MAKGKDGGGGGNSNDSKYFTTQKKGEMHELRMELHATEKHVKVDAVKKVIASMTVGKDVSMLFTDVLNCVQTGNIELKKLVYLYLSDQLCKDTTRIDIISGEYICKRFCGCQSLDPCLSGAYHGMYPSGSDHRIFM